ncbi:flagellar basal body rod protein FlgB [Paenibacillus crassostreae]|uniref:Flagellar basal body rod protein FlgB n=1 Tax=Paenibacillus crassostreae TaxID=1763538 RepID=A0A167FNV2_9BACL|nr:flagellar basal body rod protein FlgB [Paenibacillus crassostreae]AOZ94214.1 flagellar basal-body rod protein FlgB [Paenibacillus crassostreae]OAB76750.1 flagellar biosynthesis protein FlgB [Paenibacillus crassostreae]
MNLLSGTTFQKLQGALEASNTRQQVITNNIANKETPYFKRSEVSFESLLEKEMNEDMPVLRGIKTDNRHFSIGPSTQIPSPVITQDTTTVMNNNLNNVDVEQEMALLADNQLRYNSYISVLNEKIKMMRTAVQGS